jgi:Protein of unknown function (DUF3592)
MAASERDHRVRREALKRTGKGTTHTWIEGSYTYRWHGANYTSHDLGFRGREADVNLFCAYEDTRVHGAAVPAWLDPQDPMQATLDRDYSSDLRPTIAGFAVGGAFYCGACIACIVGVVAAAIKVRERRLERAPGVAAGASAYAAAAASNDELGVHAPDAVAGASAHAAGAGGEVELGARLADLHNERNKATRKWHLAAVCMRAGYMAKRTCICTWI